MSCDVGEEFGGDDGVIISEEEELACCRGRLEGVLLRDRCEFA